jgi:septal ring factor EnvC (AmiA/AmiB activator)
LTEIERFLTTTQLLMELTEGDARIRSYEADIDRKRKEIEKVRDSIRTIKDRQRRHAEMEREYRQSRAKKEANEQTRTDEQTTADSEMLRDGSGRLIGFRRKWGNRTVFLNAKGKLVAREVAGRTYDSKGRLSGFGNQGLRLLSTSNGHR